jgi:hypothetical protein
MAIKRSCYNLRQKKVYSTDGGGGGHLSTLLFWAAAVKEEDFDSRSQTAQ